MLFFGLGVSCVAVVNAFTPFAPCYSMRLFSMPAIPSSCPHLWKMAHPGFPGLCCFPTPLILDCLPCHCGSIAPPDTAPEKESPSECGPPYRPGQTDHAPRFLNDGPPSPFFLKYLCRCLISLKIPYGAPFQEFRPAQSP